jgi:hypothetical protein
MGTTPGDFMEASGTVSVVYAAALARAAALW